MAAMVPAKQGCGPHPGKLNGFFAAPPFILSAALLLSLTGIARAELHVWPLTETRHVLRSEPAGSGGAARPLLNYRVPAWMAWRDGMKGLLYWGGMSYWRQTEDPWVQAPFYTGNGKPQQGAKGIVFQGEGSLVYPARAVGYDGVVPTIRLKTLRDSIEDYEYLAILQRQGKGQEAQKVVRSLTETFFQWEKAPAAYEQARAKLATLITP